MNRSQIKLNHDRLTELEYLEEKDKEIIEKIESSDYELYSIRFKFKNEDADKVSNKWKTVTIKERYLSGSGFAIQVKDIFKTQIRRLKKLLEL